mmetsp:Transcript_45628/g.46083  ORF Transcript_45628/g.46083 Transcript_45628/m.46083 type:complete len:103 (-) Transcript_45628:451-759(-)
MTRTGKGEFHFLKEKILFQKLKQANESLNEGLTCKHLYSYSSQSSQDKKTNLSRPPFTSRYYTSADDNESSNYLQRQNNEKNDIVDNQERMYDSAFHITFIS